MQLDEEMRNINKAKTKKPRLNPMIIAAELMRFKRYLQSLELIATNSFTLFFEKISDFINGELFTEPLLNLVELRDDNNEKMRSK